MLEGPDCLLSATPPMRSYWPCPMKRGSCHRPRCDTGIPRRTSKPDSALPGKKNSCQPLPQRPSMNGGYSSEDLPFEPKRRHSTRPDWWGQLTTATQQAPSRNAERILRKTLRGEMFRATERENGKRFVDPAWCDFGAMGMGRRSPRQPQGRRSLPQGRQNRMDRCGKPVSDADPSANGRSSPGAKPRAIIRQHRCGRITWPLQPPIPWARVSLDHVGLRPRGWTYYHARHAAGCPRCRRRHFRPVHGCGLIVSYRERKNTEGTKSSCRHSSSPANGREACECRHHTKNRTPRPDPFEFASGWPAHTDQKEDHLLTTKADVLPLRTGFSGNSRRKWTPTIILPGV